MSEYVPMSEYASLHKYVLMSEYVRAERKTAIGRLCMRVILDSLFQKKTVAVPTWLQ